MKLKQYFKFHSPIILYCSLIFALSSQSNLHPSGVFEIWDKLNHFGAYFLMMLFMFISFRNIFVKKSLIKILLISFIATSIFGITDELHQYFVPNRTCDYRDWLADSIGRGLAGVLIYLIYKSRIKKGLDINS